MEPALHRPFSRRVAFALFGLAALAAWGAAAQTASDAPALDGQWRVTRIGADPAPTRRAPFLEFQGLTFGGRDGCNAMRGTLTRLDGRAIVFGEAATTRMACPPPTMRVADSLHEALRAARAYRIENDVLTLVDAQGGVALVARKAR